MNSNIGFARRISGRIGGDRVGSSDFLRLKEALDRDQQRGSKHPSAAKAGVVSMTIAARLKPCPVTKRVINEFFRGMIQVVPCYKACCDEFFRNR
jgi:hypothetical protein